MIPIPIPECAEVSNHELWFGHPDGSAFPATDLQPDELLRCLRALAVNGQNRAVDGTIDGLEIPAEEPSWLTQERPRDYATQPCVVTVFTDGTLTYNLAPPPVDEVRPKPLVLVVENPDEDPDVLWWGDVDVWVDSSYPCTKYAASERRDGGYDDYATESRRLADEAERRGAHDIAEVQRRLADEFDEAVARDGGRD